MLSGSFAPSLAAATPSINYISAFPPRSSASFFLCLLWKMWLPRFSASSRDPRDKFTNAIKSPNAGIHRLINNRTVLILSLFLLNPIWFSIGSDLNQIISKTFISL